ncbi:MAG: AI-2E family transporter [Cyanobacteriota bacterium]|nr:AI-2E family transporter [Cyanobacteriota bacterium]
MKGRALLGGLALVALALLAWQLRWVLMILFGAVVLAVAVDVPISLLRRHLPLNRPVALLLVLLVLVGVGSQLVALLLPEVLEQLDTLQRIWPTLTRQVLDLLGSVKGLAPGLDGLERQLANGPDWQRLQPLGGQLLGMAGGAANITVQVLLMVLLALLLALDPRSHQRLLVALTPAFYRSRMRLLLRECREALGGWLAGMTISALAVFLLTWAGLAILRVPLALLSALVCGLLTFVPTVGPTAATLLPMAVALLVSPLKLVQVLVLRLVLQNAEAFLLTPLLLSRTAHLLPTVALMAQLCLGALLGLPGLLLALPLVVVLQVVGREVLVHDIMDRWTGGSGSRSMAATPAPPPPAGG